MTKKIAVLSARKAYEAPFSQAVCLQAESMICVSGTESQEGFGTTDSVFDWTSGDISFIL